MLTVNAALEEAKAIKHLRYSQIEKIENLKIK